MSRIDLTEKREDSNGVKINTEKVNYVDPDQVTVKKDGEEIDLIEEISHLEIIIDKLQK